MINQSALFNLTQSRTPRSLLGSLLFRGLATITLFTPIFFFIELSYFMRNIFKVVSAITKTVEGQSIFTYILHFFYKAKASLPYSVLFKGNPLMFK